MESRCVLPTTQFAYRKGLGSCDNLLCVVHTLQCALEMGQKACMVQIYFGIAFDRFTHQGILFKFYSVGIGGSVLFFLTEFLSNNYWSQYVVLDGCRSKLFNVVSVVPRGPVLDLQLFLLYTAELFFIVESKLNGYPDDYTLAAVMSSPAERVAVTEAMNRDQNRVCLWSDLWGMKLNVDKTKTMIIAWLHTVHPQLTH